MATNELRYARVIKDRETGKKLEVHALELRDGQDRLPEHSERKAMCGKLPRQSFWVDADKRIHLPAVSCPGCARAIEHARSSERVRIIALRRSRGARVRTLAASERAPSFMVCHGKPRIFELSFHDGLHGMVTVQIDNKTAFRFAAIVLEQEHASA